MTVTTAPVVRSDHRGSPIPTARMITTRMMELRTRRGLMAALILVTVGIPTVFLVIRLLLHAFAPKSYGPAGGYDIFSGLVAGVMYVFGFIMAATLGATAGSNDLSEGMFRHLVVTGRSRLALYLARIPAGLAIIVALVALGYTVICAVCVYAAPTSISYQGASNIPARLALPAFETWAGEHPDAVLCNFPYRLQTPPDINCRNGPGGAPGEVRVKIGPSGPSPVPSTPAEDRALAIQVAKQDYPGYTQIFLYPSNSLMIKTGLWLELEAAVGFLVGLGLASLLGQRTVAVILLIVLEVVLTPIASMAHLPHLSNLQRAVVGLATAHLEPSGLAFVFGGGGGGGEQVAAHGGRVVSQLLPESTTVAVAVILAWIVGWTIIGAWRMATRDA